MYFFCVFSLQNLIQKSRYEILATNQNLEKTWWQNLFESQSLPGSSTQEMNAPGQPQTQSSVVKEEKKGEGQEGQKDSDNNEIDREKEGKEGERIKGMAKVEVEND